MLRYYKAEVPIVAESPGIYLSIKLQMIDHLSFFLVHYDFKIVFCCPPKFDFTVRLYVLSFGLENLLTILATMRRALSVRCTRFLQSSHTWSRSVVVETMTKARTIQPFKGNSQGR